MPIGEPSYVTIASTPGTPGPCLVWTPQTAVYAVSSDAICVLCPRVGPAEPFGGPLSTWGSRLAQATYDAVTAGINRQRDVLAVCQT